MNKWRQNSYSINPENNFALCAWPATAEIEFQLLLDWCKDNNYEILNTTNRNADVWIEYHAYSNGKRYCFDTGELAKDSHMKICLILVTFKSDAASVHFKLDFLSE